MNTLTRITLGRLQPAATGRVYIDGIEYLDTTDLPNLHKVSEPEIEIVVEGQITMIHQEEP